jgi:hypothetical protein
MFNDCPWIRHVFLLALIRTHVPAYNKRTNVRDRRDEKMNRGNKLWEGHRMILPEHRNYMLEREDHSMYRERPVLDEDRLEEMSRTLGEAMHEGRLVTLTVFHPAGDEEVRMIPMRLEEMTLKGLDVGGRKVSVLFGDVVHVE